MDDTKSNTSEDVGAVPPRKSFVARMAPFSGTYTDESFLTMLGKVYAKEFVGGRLADMCSSSPFHRLT